MSKNLSDIDLIKNNLSENELLSMSAISAVIGLACTGILSAAGYAISWVLSEPALSNETRSVIIVALFVGAVVAFLEASECYYSSIKTLKDIIYNANIESSFDGYGTSVVIATISACITGLLGVLLYTDPSTVGKIIIISTVFSGFFFYIYRKKELTVRKALTYICYGGVTGIAAFWLGVLITISIGMIGLLLTAGIIIIEVIFTAMFIYISLCEWVEKQRRQIKYDEERAAKEALKAAAKLEEERNAGSH